MDFYQAKDFLKEMYPGKEIKYEFDEACHRTKEFVYTDGKPNIVHHIECNKVKYTVEGLEAKYLPIMPQRFNLAWADMKKMISDQVDVHINPSEVDELKKHKASDMQQYAEKIKTLSGYSGLTQDQIEAKLQG